MVPICGDPALLEGFDSDVVVPAAGAVAAVAVALDTRSEKSAAVTGTLVTHEVVDVVLSSL